MASTGGMDLHRRTQKMILLAQPHVADEQVLAAGVFQPRGTEGMMAAGGAVGTLLTMAASKEISGLPRWTLLAVTPTRVHAFACRGGFGWAVERQYATWDRQGLNVTSRTRLTTHSLVIAVPAEGRRYEFETPSLGPFRANLDVVKVLTETT